MLEDALNDDVSRLLVLEDDSIFSNNFFIDAPRFLKSVPDHWDQLYFGGITVGRTQEINDRVRRTFGVVLTNAYAIQGRFIRVMYEFLSSFRGGAGRKGWCDVDQQMAQIHEDPKYFIYCPTSWLARQTPRSSDTKRAKNRIVPFHDADPLGVSAK